MVSSVRNYFFLYFIYLQSAGSYSFSIGITEVLNTNLVLELSANDVEYVYQRYYNLLGLYIWFRNSNVLYNYKSWIWICLFFTFVTESQIHTWLNLCSLFNYSFWKFV